MMRRAPAAGGSGDVRGHATRRPAPRRAGPHRADPGRGVANLNLSVANVALPDIGKHFDSSQTMLDLIAVGYSLGLAGIVLYLGALGDRYGRKMMLLLGLALSVPACLLAAFAPSDVVLFGARVLGGVSAGMAYPTTLALIAALWSGPGPHQVDRSVVRARRRDRVARPGGRRRAARAVRLGLGLRHHAPAGGGRVPDGREVRARPRQRDRRSRSTTSAASSRSCSSRR